MIVKEKGFIGREEELNLFNQAYNGKSSKIIALYGRRRIGKSYLVRHFIAGKRNFSFEGLERASTQKQLTHFFNSLREQTNDPLLVRPFSNWNEALNFFTDRQIKSSKEKTIIFFDELQWLAVGRGALVSLIKYYWDNFWSKEKVLLILCGSISSFMVNKVIKSKALYGRISNEICLKEMSPNQALRMLDNKFTDYEILDTLLCFGAVPKYLEEINTNQSVAQNIIRQCFKPEGFFFNEFEKIFYSQFKEHKIYERIIRALSKAPLEFSEIAQQIKFSSGGGLSRYLDNLEQAQFIIEVTPFGSKGSKLKRYQLSDPYINFYLKFIAPNKRSINSGSGQQLFNKIKQESFDIYLGLAFERFCLQYAKLLAKVMGFAESFLYAAPYFQKGAKGYQIDLLFERTDNIIVIAEIKYSKQPISTQIIPEMERKLSLFKPKSKSRIQKALISLSGPSEALKDAEYFDYYLSGLEVFEV